MSTLTNAMDADNSIVEGGGQSSGDSDKSTPQGYPSSANSTPPPTFADSDRWHYHTEFDNFKKDLQAAANSVFPNDRRTRYSKVFVLMLSWADEDPKLPVSLEIDKLRGVFRDVYHYETERWDIPAENCHYKLTEKIMDFVKPEEHSKTHLKIVYYAGHARLLDTRLLVWTSWQNNRKAKCPIVKWGGIQTILEEAQSDVLILLDCCASGTANASEGIGVNELISACAFNETANGVGPYSFTSALVTELRLLSNRPSFSVGELYKRVFFRTQCRMPEELYQDGSERERHPAPIHLVLTQGGPMPRSIQLSAKGHNPSQGPPQRPNIPTSSEVTELLDDSLPIQKNPAGPKGPRLIFAIRLNNTFRPGEDLVDHFTEWIRSLPTIAYEMKVEAVFDSLSTIMILSLPMSISAYLPRDPAIISLGPIMSPNRMLPKSTVRQELPAPRMSSPHVSSHRMFSPRMRSPRILSPWRATPLAPAHYTPSSTNIDQKWGTLFDSEGNPTRRMGGILRGLANHIIEKFTPKKSILITPSKMAQFYARYALQKEPHPLLFSIFQVPSNEHISRLYQDLGCQHCLMQKTPTSAPIVPALTSVGFAHWEAILILAYPDEEWDRLSRVVLDLPVEVDDEVIDGKPERLPNQIPRHLLPERYNHTSRKLFDRAIVDFFEDLGGSNSRIGPVHPFEYTRPTVRSTGQQASGVRERVPKTYDHGRELSSPSSVNSFASSSRPSSSVIDSKAPSVFSTGHGHRSVSRDASSTESAFLNRKWSMDTTSSESPNLLSNLIFLSQKLHLKMASTTAHLTPAQKTLLPKDKCDDEAVDHLNTLSSTEIQLLIPNLLTWLQDINWPIAMPIAKILLKQETQKLVVEPVREILRGNDEVWKYWVLGHLVMGMDREQQEMLRAEIERIAMYPTKEEKEAEADDNARDVLEKMSGKLNGVDEGRGA